MGSLIARVAALVAALWALVIRRRSRLPAEIRIVDPEGAPTIDAQGAARSVQAAELTIPTPDALELWSPEALERLARTYWRFLERCSLGLIRVAYGPNDRAVVLLCRPFVLIRFDSPQYELDHERGVVRWRIRGGALVSHRQERRGGFLQIDVRRMEPPRDGYQAIHVEVAVLSFYPAIATLGPGLYERTQAAIHVLVTHGFLRSLASLHLAKSRTGRFARAQ
ncbi:MAG TPA: hypothetical protein VHX66_06005 [Solirubrobacteraceae bacterium]|jgi:hypothetical protein|nr:hypothetical protein [Solirubrobacteraceae bacterium]